MTATEPTITSRLRCPICSTYGDLASDRWQLRACPSCTHVWADRPIEADTNEMFESHDYATWRVASATQRDRQRRIAEDRIAWVRPHLRPKGRSLEIGCSTGEVVSALAWRGWDAYGIDLSEPAIEAGRHTDPTLNLAAAATPFEARYPTNDYDIVMAFHVIEHVPELDSFVAMIHDALAPGGLIYLRMPNWESWSRRMFGDRWPSNVPEHVHHFTARSITRLLDRHGFRAIETATLGVSRDWIGGARRTLSSEWSTDAACAPVGDRSLRLLRAADRIGRPLFAIEESFDRGSELIAIGRREA